ncbi:cystathionine gamma-lyase [Tribolium castaneum]|uniref:cystathionine gamma-lyase n=1 Tax=Tribolium castaneum TaxID=7070 RepID=D6X383_TRICA|nr:PREDICTED: cystathionine gamma-lyase [Tribolium castaneum]XP_008198026.1 PREDICTED: cystathionine gamma-lyase [Tribolium castaneum]XP_972447.1 PREDICTED: cystathionine gamma-lyase [Tribolium castaneum]EFA10345.1 Cystathionine gamma-lyase-like Protein [Tribolium castaneum]|eukprot:XP_008198025.1 PREDICTED: cystathionine gamma-lyase [Tribolium castaneum]
MSGESGYLPQHKGFATAAIHAFQEPEQWESLAVVTPMVSSTTFKQYGPANFKKYEYGRSGNPSREVLEKCLATLDNGKYGLCWSSGLGATTGVASLFTAGDHIICGDDVYGGTNRLFRQVCSKFGLEITFVNEKEIEKNIKPNTKLIWIESLTNPTLKVMDIKATAELAHKHNVLLAVDSTFVTPYFQHPLDFGADLVIHSITKYINGHSDVIMGATITNNKEIYDKLKFLQNSMGIIPAPFDCYQVTRSLKTLALRMQQHMKNSIQVAKFLEKHPKVARVVHPGLPSHPQHDIFKRQSSGCSGIMSFYLKNATLEQSRTFLSALKIFTLAESLGGYESLAELPSVMTHASVPEDQRKVLKITDDLIRLSVGLEDIEDLISDLQQALEKI